MESRYVKIWPPPKMRVTFVDFSAPMSGHFLWGANIGNAEFMATDYFSLSGHKRWSPN